MNKKLSKNRKFVVILGAVFLVIGAVGLIITALSNQKFSLDSDQLGSTEYIDITGEEYEKLLNEKKSFLVFVDQSGCITAEGLRKNLEEIQKERNFKVYRIMFSDARETSMSEYVKFYPSLVIVGQGEIKSWLKADADEDTERYKTKVDLEDWLNKYIRW
ncbi:hypothetical protein IKG45_02350 [Candidatus Saccharibacteria bacterium]|nr:hypothetical protein [Candidatus Saccharibacteria bacterium]